MIIIVGFQLEALHQKERYYLACGSDDSIKWDVDPKSANFSYRQPSGNTAYGTAPEEWLKEVGGFEGR